MATRYTKFVVMKRRMDRLKEKIKWFETLGRDGKVNVRSAQMVLRKQLELMEAHLTSTYQIINLMDSERMKEITELRYIDGYEWKEIKDYTGLSLPRLYQINLDINAFFTTRGKDDLLYSERYNTDDNDRKEG